MFDSYFWRDAPLDTEQLTHARDRLAAGTGSVGDFAELLASGSPVAACVAFDQYRRSESLTRFGGDNPFEAYDAEILAEARRMLRLPPFPAADQGIDMGLNHVSALLVLGDLGECEDAELTAPYVRNSRTRDAIDASLFAAGSVLFDGDETNEELLAAVEEILFDASRPQRDRLDCLSALSRIEKPAVGNVLARFARHESDEKLHLETLCLLTADHLETHGDVVEEFAAEWPQSPPEERGEMPDTKDDILRILRSRSSK